MITINNLACTKNFRICNLNKKPKRASMYEMPSSIDAVKNSRIYASQMGAKNTRGYNICKLSEGQLELVSNTHRRSSESLLELHPDLIFETVSSKLHTSDVQ
jgi:hypothetical protein